MSLLLYIRLVHVYMFMATNMSFQWPADGETGHPGVSVAPRAGSGSGGEIARAPGHTHQLPVSTASGTPGMMRCASHSPAKASHITHFI